MRILVSYRGIPGRPGWANGDCMVRAFRELGHEAIPYGNIYQTRQPIAPDTNVSLGFVDALLWMECNDADPQYTELLSLRCRKILWDFDTSMHPDYTLGLSEHFDTVYVANSRCLRDGWQHLPYGVDHHKFKPRKKTGGVGIVGTPFPARVKFAEAVGAEMITGLYCDDYARRIAELDIHVHHYDSGGDGLLVSRIWETLASGTVLLTQDTTEIREVFKDGTHLRLYHGPESCRRIVEELMGHWENRQPICDFGRNEVLAKHTWTCRARRILADLGVK